MTQSSTILEQIEVNAITGQTFVQWRKQIIADNGAVIFSEPHRTSLEPAHYAVNGLGKPSLDGTGQPILIPATDLAKHIALVDAHLVTLGFPATAPSDRAAVALHDAGRLAVVPVKPVVAA